jgi:hypothetical protein
VIFDTIAVPGLAESHTIIYGRNDDCMVVLTPDTDVPHLPDAEQVSEIFRAGLRAGLELARSIAKEMRS